MSDWTVESTYGAATRKPLVTITVDGKAHVIDAGNATSLGLSIIEAAQSARCDAALVDILPGVTDADRGAALLVFRDAAAAYQRPPEPGRVLEDPPDASASLRASYGPPHPVTIEPADPDEEYPPASGVAVYSCPTNGAVTRLNRAWSGPVPPGAIVGQCGHLLPLR